MKRTGLAPASLLVLTLALPASAAQVQANEPLAVFVAYERLVASISEYLGMEASAPEREIQSAAATATSSTSHLPATGTSSSAVSDTETDQAPILDPNG